MMRKSRLKLFAKRTGEGVSPVNESRLKFSSELPAEFPLSRRDSRWGRSSTVSAKRVSEQLFPYLADLSGFACKPTRVVPRASRPLLGAGFLYLEKIIARVERENKVKRLKEEDEDDETIRTDP